MLLHFQCIIDNINVEKLGFNLRETIAFVQSVKHKCKGGIDQHSLKINYHKYAVKKSWVFSN